MAVRLMPEPEFDKETLPRRMLTMNLAPYFGHSFECACGQRHLFEPHIVVKSEVFRGFIIQCPDSPEYLTRVKLTGMFKFKGFESLYGTTYSPPKG